MFVRIRLARGGRNRHKIRKIRRLIRAVAALLQPAVVMAGVLAFWRFGADLHWTREFAISSGLFSHWQVWLAIGAALQAMVIALNDLGRKLGSTGNPPPYVEPLETETEQAPLLKSKP